MAGQTTGRTILQRGQAFLNRNAPKKPDLRAVPADLVVDPEEAPPPGHYPAEIEPVRDIKRKDMSVRVLGVVCVALALAVMASVFGIVVLLDVAINGKIVPWVLTMYEKTAQVGVLEPLQKGTLGWEQAVRMEVRKYVEQRERILPAAEAMRLSWGEGGYVQSRTTADKYAEFKNDAYPVLRDMLGKVTRKIEVISSGVVSYAKVGRHEGLLFVVEYLETDTLVGNAPRTRERQAWVTAIFVPQTVTNDEMEAAVIRSTNEWKVNVTGFTVADYRTVDKATGQTGPAKQGGG